MERTMRSTGWRRGLPGRQGLAGLAILPGGLSASKLWAARSSYETRGHPGLVNCQSAAGRILHQREF